MKVIVASLEGLGYHVYYSVLNTATHANIPQNRERLFIVCFKEPTGFTFPLPISLTRRMDRDATTKYYTSDSNIYERLAKEVTKENVYYQWRRKYVRENKSGLCPTLTANMGTGGHNVPIIKDKFGIRKLTPRECFDLQGYPSDFILPSIADNHLYKQAGNSVTTTLIKRIAEQIIKVI